MIIKYNDKEIIMPTTTREEFNEEVQKFKKKHQGKLKNLLDKTKHPKEAQEFWENPIIRSYLSRSHVDFKGSHPDLSSELDKYELKIYEHFPHAIAYRDSLINTLNFTSGGFESKEFSDYFHNLSHSNDVEVRGLGDIYKIKNDVYTRFLKSRPPEKSIPRFILSPNWKDGHATTCLTILDDKTQKPLVTIFINSWQNEQYFNNIKRRMNMKSSYTDLYGTDEIAIKQDCHDVFGVDIEQENSSERRIWKTTDENTILILDNEFKMFDPELDNFEREADVVYDAARDEEGKIFLRGLKQNIPFIDASHHLQTTAGDRSCTLYGLNFIQALTTFLENTANADHMYELAKKIKNDPEASKSLTRIIQEDLKPYLPEYYTKTGEARDPKDISDFHIKQRWDIGGQTIPKIIPEIKSSLPKDLRDQRTKYFQLIDELNVISQRCEQQGNKKDHQIMNQLCHNLSKAGDEFFKPISGSNSFASHQNRFKTFSDAVVTCVRKSDEHFCKSGFWYDYIHPVLKSIISGLLDAAACLSIITPKDKTNYLDNTFESVPNKKITQAYRGLAIEQRLIDEEKGLIKDIEETIKPKK